MTNKFLTVEVDSAPPIILSIDEKGMLSLACEEGTPTTLVQYLFAMVSDALAGDSVLMEPTAKILRRVANLITAELKSLVADGHIFKHPFIDEWGFDKEADTLDPMNVYVADFKFSRDRYNIQ